jgi:hypothetical protein
MIFSKPSQQEFYSLKNTHKISCLGRYNFMEIPMNRIFQVFMTFAFVTCCSYAQDQHSTVSKNILLAHWVFNKPSTIENFRNSDMSQAEFKVFSSILKPAEIVIADKLYSSHIQGRNPTQTPYSIISISDNGECFKLQFKDPRIPLDIQKNEMCVVNNRLLLPGPKGTKEIFDRKL